MAKVVIRKSSLLKEESSPERSKLSLPDDLSEPAKRLQDYSILLYGTKKIGKTTMMSHGENTFFMMFEPGGKALAIYQRPVKSWEDFKGYVSLIIKDKKFINVVIDTVDIAYKLCSDSVCEEHNIDHPSDEEWGKGWGAVRDEFTREINRLLHSGKGVVFISHAKEIEIKTRIGLKYNMIVPTASGQARETLEGLVDIWVHYGYDKGHRILTIEGDDHIGAGHRLKKRFKYTNGEPIKEINMGSSDSEAYENFIKAFNNKLEKGGQQTGKGLEEEVVVHVEPKKKFVIKRRNK